MASLLPSLPFAGKIAAKIVPTSNLNSMIVAILLINPENNYSIHE